MADDNWRAVIPDHHDPIRIVPLHLPDEIPAPGPGYRPHLSYRDGPLLTDSRGLHPLLGQ
jgi:hypothetical protein